MDERLRLAYATAMRATHGFGRVEIHLGSDVVADLKAMMPKGMRDDAHLAEVETIWGFPIVDTTASPDHISVHVVTTIA